MSKVFKQYAEEYAKKRLEESPLKFSIGKEHAVESESNKERDKGSPSNVGIEVTDGFDFGDSH